MKSMCNKVQLIGRLGMDPDVREFGDKNKMARFSMATSEKYKDAKGTLQENTQWHNIVVWGKLSNVVEEYLTKGSEVAVEGKLSYRNFEDKEGNKKSSTEIIVNELVMLRKPATAKK
ncbi:MAG: single-stranded DNA-binding protein [Flavobacteriales bacterium]|nr:single-stranded DNA-binding protein [Flavobacteriales bacterium]